MTDSEIPVAEANLESREIPTSYVPFRNAHLLSIATSWAEVIAANRIYIGAVAEDSSGYPDCRPEFMRAFEELANLATKAAIEGNRVRIRTPIIDLTKAEIIRRGTALGVDYSLTVSCYQPAADAAACGRCDSCRLRRSGFEAAGIPDPTRYAA